MDDAGPFGIGDPLYTAVLEATATGPGTRLLDLGCGPGRLARAAADRGAVVTGLDTDPAAVARAAAAVPEGTFAVGDALDPPPGPFDAAAAVQLLPHVPDPAAALRAAARVAPVVVATVWGPVEQCDVRLFGEALSPWLGPPPRPERPDPATLAGRAGLVVERVADVVCPSLSDDEDLLAALFAAGLGQAAVRRAGPAAVRDAVLTALEPHRVPDGRYRLTNAFRVLVARPA